MQVEGQCLFLFTIAVGAVVVACLCLALCMVLRFCCLALSPARNPDVLKEALSHRRRTKAHDHSLPGNPLFAFDETNVRTLPVSGLAPTLYFRFIAFLAVLGIIMTSLLCFGLFLPQLVGPDVVEVA